MKKYLLSPSMIAANFAILGKEMKDVINAGADIIHFDVMDNHYAPNLSVGPMVLKSLRQYGITAPIDVHLMINPVDSIIPEFVKAGANSINFHPETTNHIERTIQLIKQNGCKVGLVFNPTTLLNYLNYIIDKIDIIILMSVNPGFCGQTFIPSTLRKLNEARKLIDQSGYEITLAVDGGITMNNIDKLAEAGANMFIIGSAIFDYSDYQIVINNMRKKLIKTYM
ncbi:MAG: ribulose-phosphate 3-epimerase [Pantoea sp. Brub]|nr:ribulose-phosphate 3-epimerase [Pantoea sp. Brub]